MLKVLPDDVWAGWLERACAINEYAAPDRSPSRTYHKGTPAGEDSPGTDFNRRGSWDEAGLFDAGWKWVRQSSPDQGLITRPGKDGGVSASIGTVTSKENGWPLFYCWSTSVPDFVAEQPYTRFAVFAILRHKGDYAEAAKDLAARGYGRPPAEVPQIVFGQQPPGGNGPTSSETPADPERIFRWMSELRHQEANDKWLWDGYLSRGGVTLITALWKAGKSTLLSHLIRAFDGRSAEFLGRPITPARVLYISEEHEELWAERRDELNIGDHVGMISRPFRSRPSPAEWAAFIGGVAKAVVEYRFDVVIFDTLSKLWPVREENDAGQVEDALMPVWNITNTGAALGLVHHSRKSKGGEFTDSRGSGGLPSFCETLITFSRHDETNLKDRKRLLTGAGRYRETPTKWLIELQPSGYVSHGDPDDLSPDQRVTIGYGDQGKAEAWKQIVLDFLPVSGRDAKPYPEIQSAIVAKLGHGIRREQVCQWLDSRVEDGELYRIGLGTRGSPHRWYRIGDDAPDSCPTPWVGTGTESGTESEDGE